MTTTERPELSFDGFGINGPDEHRSRVATFANAEIGRKYGPLFAAAPDLLYALEAAVLFMEDAEDNPLYKPGVVKQKVKEIESLLEKVTAYRLPTAADDRR